MDNRFNLRRAIDADNVALSELNQQTYRETYVDDFPAPYNEHALQSHFQSSINSQIFANKIANPQQAIWIIEDKTIDEFVAFAIVGPCSLSHPDIRRDEDGELYRLHVRRDRQGYGLGQWLMSVTLSWLEERFPGRPIWLGVWSSNLKAQNFYKHYNFNKIDDGDYYSHVGEHKYHNYIMQRESCPS